MFLTERIIGIFVFAATLILISILISSCNSIQKTKKILIIYLLLLFLMGYFYCPYKTADLFYIENLINTNLKNKNLAEILTFFQNAGYRIFYIYYWIFGKIGNVRLLPATTAALFYGNCFYILYKSSIRFNLSSKSMSRTLLFFMAGGQFLEVISGIKSLLAFSIVALCCYKEFVDNKSFISQLPLYLLASLLHDAALIAVGFRLFYLLFQKEKKIIVRIRNYLLFGIFIFLAFKYGKEIILGATNKGQGYINGTVYSNSWEYIIAVISDLFMIYSIFLINKITKIDIDLKNNIRKLLHFITWLLLFDCVFVFEYSIFHRYRTFIMLLIIPLVGILFEKCKNKEYAFLNKYYAVFQLYFVLSMGLSLIRGNLSSLKFFELENKW